MACPFCSGKKKEDYRNYMNYMNYMNYGGSEDFATKILKSLLPELAKLYSSKPAPRRPGYFHIYKYPNMTYMYNPWTNEMEIFHDAGDTETFFSNTEKPGMLLQSLYMGSRRGLGDANASGMSYPINGAPK